MISPPTTFQNGLVQAAKRSASMECKTKQVKKHVNVRTAFMEQTAAVNVLVGIRLLVMDYPPVTLLLDPVSAP